MIKNYRQGGAVGALLDEYERAIEDLLRTIDDISDEELIKIADSNTTDPNCRSIQTVLSHIVKAGYGYAVYIRQLRGGIDKFPAVIFRSTVNDYLKDLNDFFIFTIDTFKNIPEIELEEYDNSKKILTSWGQYYDIEQITEHAIVHILRHRRQIEKFKIILR